MGGAVNGVSQVAAIADGKQDQIDVASLGMAIGMGGLLGAANLPGSKTAMATLTVAGAAGTISAYQKGENYTAIACAAGTLLAGAAFGLSFTNKTRGPSTPAGVAPKANAAAASLAEANAAQADGLRGTASVLEVNGQVFPGRSTGARGGPLHPRVQAAYDGVPPEVHPPYHSKCAEGRSLSAALEAGVDPMGGTSVATTIGGPKHGTPKPACPSCAWVLKFFGVIDGVE